MAKRSSTRMVKMVTVVNGVIREKVRYTYPKDTGGQGVMVRAAYSNLGKISLTLCSSEMDRSFRRAHIGLL